MAMMSCRLVGVGFALSSLGCSEEAERPFVEQEEPTTAAPDVFVRNAHLLSKEDVSDGPRLFIDDEGRSWTARAAVHGARADVAAPPPDVAPTSAMYGAMSDRELAARWRAIRYHQGVEYTAIDVDEAETRKLRGYDREQRRMRTGPANPGQSLDVPRPETTGLVQPDHRTFFDELRPFVTRTQMPGYDASPTGEFLPQSPRVLIGTDDRFWIDPSSATSWPNSTQVSFSMGAWPSGAYCSGTMIGRWTAISAAHCFFDHDANPPAWTVAQGWAIGAVRRRGFMGGVQQTVAYGPINSTCYTVTIPTAWITTRSRDEDVAVVDFGPCGLAPGDTTGWLYSAIGSSGDYLSAYHELRAYDTASTPPNPGFLPYYLPSLIGRTGGAGGLSIPSGLTNQLQYSIDTDRGASGGGVMAQVFSNVGDPTMYWVGPHVGASSSGATNRARRLTWGLWGFIGDNTSEW